VRAAVRTNVAGVAAGADVVRGTLLDSTYDWRPAVEGCNAVVHTAARVHVMRETATDPEAAFHEANVVGTLQLARAASEAGVRRFVFVSSVKVNGEGTPPGEPFRAADAPAPRDAYGRSKLAAEKELLALASQSHMEVVVVRPVLVYGPGVRANFAAMMRWLARGVPLPFAAIRNRRSLVFVENLVDLLATTLAHPKAGNSVFLVSDGDDLSTPELLRRTATALGRRARLFPMPAGMLKTAARLFGRGAEAERLIGSLQVDIAPTRELLGWNPPVRVSDGLATTARWYLDHDRRSD
jgi:nucleoside-diphosphate-sugar epimerase